MQVNENTQESVEKVVNDHRKMMLTTRNVSDWQLNNITNWIYIAFPEMVDFKLGYNFVNQNDEIYAGEVTIDIKFKKNASLNNEHIELIKYNIENSIKYIFFADTNVVFKKNGRLWKNKKKITKKTRQAPKA